MACGCKKSAKQTADQAAAKQAAKEQVRQFRMNRTATATNSPPPNGTQVPEPTVTAAPK